MRLASVPALLLATPAWAQQASAPALGSAAAAGSLVQTILALVLVLGLLVGLAWFLKRFGPKLPQGTAKLRIVGALNLGGRERVIVVEVGDQWIVVGASPGRVNALATMPAQEGPAELAEPAAPAPNFAHWLKQTIEQRNAK
ncbi:MAG: flagellar biosynthetic protein FliO [Pseudomonadota bacterium]